MLRINLLPREVLDRHRFEGWYRYVFIVSTGVILVVLLVTAGLFLLVQQKTDELQTARDKVAQYTEQGKTFDVFERKEKELADRQKLAQSALSDRINAGKVAEELSMVLPDEVWLDTLSFDQGTGITFTANTPRSASKSVNVSYKSVAKTLVRVNELPEITDVWLTNAANSQWSGWQGSSVASPTPVVQFATSAKVLTPSELPPKATGK
jgi:Tfp pilus assembly protein PilN